MRSVINISITKKLKTQVEKAVKNGGYSTKSEFFRFLLRDWQEQQFLKELRTSQKAVKNGKGKILKSLKALR
jgi:Arc/MetJ-type ribon-helix-helix transcriptional regulator